LELAQVTYDLTINKEGFKQNQLLQIKKEGCGVRALQTCEICDRSRSSNMSAAVSWHLRGMDRIEGKRSLTDG
jgi:hypothetical protein